MTAASNASDLSAYYFALGQGIYAEDLAELAEQLNYSGAKNPICLAGCASGDAGWGSSTNEVETHAATSGATLVTWYTFQVDVPADAQDVDVYGRMIVPAGDVHTMDITVGGASAVTLTFDNSGGGAAASIEDTGTVATSSTGTALQTVTIETQRSSGSGTADVAAWYIRTSPIADVDLPTPTNE